MANWVKIAKFKTHQFKLNACVSMALSIQITKFKFHQHELRAVSPNLMLAKVTCYTIYYRGLVKKGPWVVNLTLGSNGGGGGGGGGWADIPGFNIVKSRLAIRVLNYCRAHVK